MINVTKPFLPPIEEYKKYLEGIWKREWLTNNGPLVNDLELKLKEYFGVPHLLYVNNGTIALQIAIKVLELRGEIVTTPFSFIATTSAIAWEECKPVFVDIERQTFNIDPSKIESVITEKTVAILATHVYGNPCNIDAIEIVAKKHGLKVIYDAAHCFGTKYKGKSVFSYGDISATSFHATKLFHTVEGGAVFTNDAGLLRRMSYIRNFGFNGPDDFAEVGINGKSSEFHAAMGLCNLNYVGDILRSRKEQSDRYNKWLTHDSLKRITITDGAEFNNAYFPVVFENEEMLLKVVTELKANWINARRYFYPSLNTMELYQVGTFPVSEDVSKRVLCLPLYHDLSVEEIDFICRLILRTLNN